MIPQATLHRELHSKIHDVPTPNGNICKSIVEQINLALECGNIKESDSPLMRLAFLSDLLKTYDGLKATRAMVDWQLEVVWKFYHGKQDSEE